MRIKVFNLQNLGWNVTRWNLELRGNFCSLRLPEVKEVWDHYPSSACHLPPDVRGHPEIGPGCHSYLCQQHWFSKICSVTASWGSRGSRSVVLIVPFQMELVPFRSKRPVLELVPFRSRTFLSGTRSVPVPFPVPEPNISFQKVPGFLAAFQKVPGIDLKYSDKRGLGLNFLPWTSEN